MATLETIHYTTLPTPDQLDAAARLIGSTLKRPLKIRPFQRAPFFVVALDPTAEVVGVAAIRKLKGNAGEFGYFAVDVTYRRLGIGTRLTETVISEARQRGVQLLYAWVEKANVASMGNLEKCGFRLFGNYVKRRGRSPVKAWVYLPLSTGIDSNSIMEEITSGLTRVE